MRSIEVIPLHETCATHLVDGERHVHRLQESTSAQVGDLVILGTTVIALREPQG